MNSICHRCLDNMYGADLNTNLSFGLIMLLANIYAIIIFLQAQPKKRGLNRKLSNILYVYFSLLCVFCIFNFRIKLIAWTAIC